MRRVRLSRNTFLLLVFIGQFFAASASQASIRKQKLKIECLSHKQRSSLQAIALEHPLSAPIQLTDSQWLSPGELLAPWFSLAKQPIVLNDGDELRFIPHTLPNSDLILLLDRFDLESWQLERVMAVAKTLQLSLHLFWLADKESLPVKLERLVASSHGQTQFLLDLLAKPDCNSQPSQSPPQIKTLSDSLIQRTNGAMPQPGLL